MLVRLLKFVSLGCGCVIGRYRELGSDRELAYVEEKGHACPVRAHVRNHSMPLSAAEEPRAPVRRVA